MGTEFVLRCEGLRVALCFLLLSSTIFRTLQELENLQNISLQLFGQVLWLLLFRRFDCKMNMRFLCWDTVLFSSGMCQSKTCMF